MELGTENASILALRSLEIKIDKTKAEKIIEVEKVQLASEGQLYCYMYVEKEIKVSLQEKRRLLADKVKKLQALEKTLGLLRQQ